MSKTQLIKWSKDSLTVNKKELPVKLQALNQVDLFFYPENPRIYSIVCIGGGTPDQAEIQEHLAKMDHVKQLIQSIKANGGLKEPLLVQDKKNVVLEGNSRLAAYRILASQDPAKWSMIKCRILPQDISEKDIFAILGTFHIVGRKDWAPFEQAGYLFRRNSKQKITTQAIANELGFTKQRVEHLIDVYSFMIKHNDMAPSQWSHYDELLKSRVVKTARDTIPNFDKTIVRKIKTGEISKAVDVRDKLPKILSASKKTVKRFMGGKVDFNNAFEMAIDQGLGNNSYLKLRNFKQWIVNSELKSNITEIQDNQKQKCLYELKKIQAYINLVIKSSEK